MTQDADTLAGHKSILRVGLVLLALSQIGVGAWALFAPMSFQNDFPGMGRHWLTVLGPYNEHLITDVGATFLALSVLLILAAIWLTRRLVQGALIAWLVYSIPHLYFHLNNLGVYDAEDQIINGVALSLQVVIGAGLLALTLRPQNRSEVSK